MGACEVKVDFDLDLLDAQIRAARDELEATRLEEDHS